TFEPPRAAIVAAGAMSHSDLLKVIEEAFSDWSDTTSSREPIAMAADRQPDVATTSHLALVPREGAAQSELRIGQLCARRDTPDYAPLVVMNAVLGGELVRRLNVKQSADK